VNTVPEATLSAFADHGSLHSADNGDAVTNRAAKAREVIDAIAATGVDLAEVFTVPERGGVDRFTRSWAELHETVRRSMEAAVE
jgi:transaldolase